MRVGVLLLPLLAGACSGVQTPLDPMGDQAARIAVLSWVLFIGATAIFALTMGLLVVALVAPARVRQAIGTRGFVIGAGIIFPTVTLVALLVYTLGVSRALVLPVEANPLRIEVIARQYWWEVRYPDSAAEGGEVAVTANEIHLPVGREVELILTSGDVIHSLWIPNLHGKMDMIPGKANRQRLRADRPGVMRGQCTEFCGQQHTLMAFWAVAHEAADFETWLARQRAPVPDPADAEQARGRTVFGEAGCGACHAVRGTSWQGRLGPDLSRIGSRLSIGAGALENHRGTLAGWIAGSQDIKPGNAMPSYGRSLEGADLLAVAAWMESLR